MTDDSPLKDLVRNILVITLIGALLVACFWILRPFLPALFWATMLSIATWPLLMLIEKKVRGRRPAVLILMILLVLTFVIPFTLAVGVIVENAPNIAALGKQLATLEIPSPPTWVERLPLIGESAANFWQQAASSQPGELASRLSPYVRNLAGWLVAQAGGFGMMLVHFVLTLILTALIYTNGEEAANLIRRLAHRIGEERGENAVILAAKSVRAVAQGVVITALVQSIMAGLGLALVGIPYASLLTALIFMLTIAQIGSGPVLIPVVIWLFWKESYGWGSAMLVWSVFVMSMDGFMRPILIRRNANLPLLLIFAGVIGGLVAFGIIGLFIGPVLLVVGYTLMKAWVDDEIAGDSIKAAAFED